MIKICKLFPLTIFLSINNIFSNISLIEIPTCKTVSIANEMSVLENNGFSVITNPSLLASTKAEYGLEYSKTLYFADSSYDLLSMLSRQNNVAVGLVVGKFSSGIIKVRNIDGILTGETFEYTYGVTSLGVSVNLLNRPFYTFRLGFSSYVFLEKIDFDFIFFGFNSGFTYDLKLKNKIVKLIRTAATVKLITTERNYIYNLGVAVKIPESMIILGFQRNSYRKAYSYKVGYIFNVYSSADLKKYLRLNLGCNYEDFATNISSGVEVGFYNFLIFYSFYNHKYLKNIHSFQVGVMY